MKFRTVFNPYIQNAWNFEKKNKSLVFFSGTLFFCILTTWSVVAKTLSPKPVSVFIQHRVQVLLKSGPLHGTWIVVILSSNHYWVLMPSAKTYTAQRLACLIMVEVFPFIFFFWFCWFCWITLKTVENFPSFSLKLGCSQRSQRLVQLVGWMGVPSPEWRDRF